MNDNLFGTDGIRSRVGDYPLDSVTLPALGHALAQWATAQYGQKPRILIAHDTRASASYIKALLKIGLLYHDTRCFDADVLSTPAVAQLVIQSGQFDCGIIISGSHNPACDNGIKVITRQTGKLSLEEELKISALTRQYFKSIAAPFSFGMDQHYLEASHTYLATMTRYFKPSFLENNTVVLDCAHGANYSLAPSVFKHFGAYVYAINASPNGTNINSNCGALYPETLQQTVKELNADIGFSFDGDGDRVIAVNRDGVIKNGDSLLAILADHLVYSNQSALVATTMTNQGLELFLNVRNKKLIRTQVGDKYVLEALETHDLLLGGEQSGHIIARDYLPTGDGIFTALRVLEVMRATDNWSLKTFTELPQITLNIPVVHKKNLEADPIAALIKNSKQRLKTGRLVVRYSGTENYLRIMVEEHDHKLMQSIAHDLAQELAAIL